MQIERDEERPIGVEDCTLYPLFTAELLEIMRRAIPRERWDRVARAVIFRADKPEATD